MIINTSKLKYINVIQLFLKITTEKLPIYYHILRGDNRVDTALPGHNIVYVPGTYQGQTTLILYFKYYK